MKDQTAKKNDFLPKILLLLFSIFFSLVILEIALRIMTPEKPLEVPTVRNEWATIPERVWVEHHPVLGWFNQKDKEAILEKPEFRIQIRTNSDGFRSLRNYEKTHSEEVKRVVFLGDSFIFGWGVTEEETLPAVLESLAPSIEAPNLGVPGYGIDQILLSFREIGRKYSPDYVFITLFPEDFWRATRSFTDGGHVKPYFKLTSEGNLKLNNVPVPPQYSLRVNQFPEIIPVSAWERFMNHSLLYRQVRRGLIRMGKNIGILDPDMTDEWILGREILKVLIQEIRDAGAHPVLMIVPSEYWVKNERPTSLFKSLHRFAEREQVDIIDPTPTFRQAIQSSALSTYYIAGDGHWTAEGHRLAAHLVKEWLEEHGNL